VQLGIMPRRRARAADAYACTSAPSSVTRPAVGRNRPARQPSRLLLPLPLWPSRNTTSPASTATETSWTTGRPAT
jgi:hypothetical protein